jgi:hypothetical protein
MKLFLTSLLLISGCSAATHPIPVTPVVSEQNQVTVQEPTCTVEATLTIFDQDECARRCYIRHENTTSACDSRQETCMQTCSGCTTSCRAPSSRRQRIQRQNCEQQCIMTRDSCVANRWWALDECLASCGG